MGELGEEVVLYKLYGPSCASGRAEIELFVQLGKVKAAGSRARFWFHCGGLVLFDAAYRPVANLTR
jgi:hypothetical protein